VTPGEGAGWFALGALVGGAAVAVYRRVEGPLAVTDEPADAPTHVVEAKNPKLVAAGRKGIAKAGLNAKRYRCAECDKTTTAGPLGVHQKKTGHTGRVEVSA
jgi:hypothetical protein